MRRSSCSRSPVYYRRDECYAPPRNYHKLSQDRDSYDGHQQRYRQPERKRRYCEPHYKMDQSPSRFNYSLERSAEKRQRYEHPRPSCDAHYHRDTLLNTTTNHSRPRGRSPERRQAYNHIRPYESRHYREESPPTFSYSRPRRRSPSMKDNTLEAPKWQQIAWSKQMTSQDATVNSVLSLFAAHGHKFNARNVATAAHRVAKIGRKQNHRLKQDCRMKALASACLNLINEFEAQGLANVAWAFATIGIEAPALFNAIAAAALKKLDKFNPQDLANTTWAFATASVEAPALFNAIAVAAVTKLGGFNPQALANTVWAFATASVEAPTLFNAIADVARTKLNQFNPQALANTAWAFALLLFFSLLCDMFIST